MPSPTVNVFGTQVNRNVLYVAAAGAAVFVGWSWFKQGTGGGSGEDVEAEFLVPEEPTGVLPFGGTASGTYTESTTFRDDRQWYEAALDKITLNYGVTDVMAAANALDRYLASQPLNTLQIPMINFVINTIGPPPSGARTIRQEPTTKPPSSAPPAKVAAIRWKAPAISRTSIRWSWEPVSGATYYNVLPRRGPASGGGNLALRAVGTPSWAWFQLKPGHAYGITVVAYNKDRREIARAFRDDRTKA